jgi:hypothetical protein
MSTGATWAVIALAGATLVGLVLVVDAWLDRLAPHRAPGEPCWMCGLAVYDPATHSAYCEGPK